jgi:putative membrane protein
MRYPLLHLSAAALLGFSVPLVHAGPPAALDDPTIVAIFDAANTYDIEAAQLALQKSHTESVRKLAQQFAVDHKNLRQQGRDLAKKLGVKPTPPAQSDLAKEHAEAMRMLRGKSGGDFDRAYAEHEVKFHETVIDAVTGTLLPAISNAELKAFVQKTAPAFQGHLAMAKQLVSQLGGSTTSS